MNQLAILESISRGFQKTTENSILNLSLMTGLLVLLMCVSAIYNHLAKNKRYSIWRKEYESLIRKFDLTINEIDFLEELSYFLIDKRRPVLLLKNRNTFANALDLWKKKEGHISEYSERLLNKIFGEESRDSSAFGNSPFGKGRPARYVAADGKVFSGIIAHRDNNKVDLENVKSLGIVETQGMNRLYIQDYKGIRSDAVTGVKKTGENKLAIVLTEKPGNKKVSLSDIYLYFPGSEVTVKSRILRLKNGMALIENPGVKIRMAQTLKLSFKSDSHSLQRVNATVTGLSINKRVIRVKFGYIRS